MAICKRGPFLAGLVALFASTLPAQLNRAVLTGVVTDPSGAAVVNARIMAVNKATNTQFATTTTDTGKLRHPGSRPRKLSCRG